MTVSRRAYLLTLTLMVGVLLASELVGLLLANTECSWECRYFRKKQGCRDDDEDGLF